MATIVRHKQSAIRVGLGYDIHRLSSRRPLWLGGLRVPSPKGAVGHSDADVVLHALTDALLGACAAGDIGEHFPDSDPRWRGAPSSTFVDHAVRLAARKGWRAGNVDVTVFAETPRLGPHKRAIARRIAGL
ncbi:MAG: 2-C-methyl-D-erythritol 2,4-cyclodiphosphate synthase, partial [Planctomycetes bacterium]|nr:2-C-methyl-D-erythritol 2,4-cyclodiphosphate synthase [Planctomycetota bacterium]